VWALTQSCVTPEKVLSECNEDFIFLI